MIYVSDPSGNFMSLKRLRRVLFKLLTVLLILLPDKTRLTADDASVIREQLLKTAPSAWESYKTYLGQSEADIIVKEVGLGKTANIKPASQIQFGMVSNLPHVQMKQFPGPDKTNITTFCINPDYAFQLSQADKNAQNIIKYFDSNPQRVFESIDSSILQYFHSGFELFGKPLSKLFSDPQFKYKETSFLMEQGRKLVRISFDYKWNGKPEEAPMTGGWMILNPENSWLIQEYEILLSRSGAGISTISGKIEYGAQDGNFLQPLKTTIRSSNDKSGHVTETISLVEKWKLKVIDPSQFYLAAFGLPEPAKKGGTDSTPQNLRTQTNFKSWLIGFGIACAIAAIALRFLAIRRS